MLLKSALCKACVSFTNSRYDDLKHISEEQSLAIKKLKTTDAEESEKDCYIDFKLDEKSTSLEEATRNFEHNLQDIKTPLSA